MYSPLKYGLTIKESKIHGLGLFATKPIKANTKLGITHIPNSYSADGYIRTPLGGFYNHSDNPNCAKEEALVGGALWLYTLRDIEAGEEITVKYTLYNIE
jgi:SET domain-containing protein